MSFHDQNGDEAFVQPRSSRRGGSDHGDDSAPTGDSTGGRSTGPITGFGGGRMGGGDGSGGAGKGGAVVKANYAKAGSAKAAKSVKASARYYTTRENERGESMEREAFAKDHDGLSRDEVYDRLERADQEHEYHYRMALSPGTDREAEGVDLKDYTREVMREVERQQGGNASWVAVEHGRDTAHTERAHVHVIVSTEHKLDREDFAKLREHATRSWDDAREHVRMLERDPTLERDIQQMVRDQEHRDLSRQPTREPSGYERGHDKERENVSGARGASPGGSGSALPERGQDKLPERSFSQEYDRDGGRGR